jgi:predicted ArsR family transcriptional regulator
VECVEGVREHFGEEVCKSSQPLRVKDIFEQVVSNSTAAEQHLMTALQQLHASKEIVVVSKDGGVRRPSKKYQSDDVIEWRKQIIIPFV